MRPRLSVIGYRLSANTENRKPSTELAFTLVELLIAVTIFAAVSAAVYAAFNSGMSIWRRAEKVSLEKTRNLVKLEKLFRELRKTFLFKEKEIAFSGDKHRIVFAAAINSEVERVTYFFDPDKKTLLRSLDKLKDIAAAQEKQEKLESKPAPYLKGVNDLNFYYFYFDLKKAAYSWKEDWKENILPLAIKLNVTLGDETYARTVFIPAA